MSPACQHIEAIVFQMIETMIEHDCEVAIQWVDAWLSRASTPADTATLHALRTKAATSPKVSKISTPPASTLAPTSAAQPLTPKPDAEPK